MNVSGLGRVACPRSLNAYTDFRTLDIGHWTYLGRCRYRRLLRIVDWFLRIAVPIIFCLNGRCLSHGPSRQSRNQMKRQVGSRGDSS